MMCGNIGEWKYGILLWLIWNGNKKIWRYGVVIIFILNIYDDSLLLSI